MREQILAGRTLPLPEVLPALQRLVETKVPAFKEAATAAQDALDGLGAMVADPKNWWLLCGEPKTVFPRPRAFSRKPGRCAMPCDIWVS